MPTMLAVGPAGVAFRGELTDYSNSSYLIKYIPTASGEFRVYVSVGCCAPHPDVGLLAEPSGMAPMLVTGAPFYLKVFPNDAVLANSIAVGGGVLGGVAGDNVQVNVFYRDVFRNPTTYSRYATVQTSLKFVDQVTGGSITPDVSYIIAKRYPDHMLITYNVTRSGTYLMFLGLTDR